MLHIHRKLHFPLPHIRHASQPIALGEPGTENDELIQAIENSRGEQWTLTNEPDVRGLEAYWSRVEHDISQDPEWFHFTE